MGVFLQYVRLEGKNLFLRLGLLLCGAAFGALFFGLAFCGLNLLLQGRLSMPKAVIGLVSEGEQDELKLFETIASSMDSVKQYCDLRLMEREEAERALKAGELQALIFFPPHFYRDVMTGVNTPARALIPESSPFQTGLFKELLIDGASLIGTAEAGIYAAEDAFSLHGGRMTRRELELELTRRFTLDALNRGGVFAERETYSLEGADLSSWHLSSFLTVFLLLSSAFPAFFYSAEELALEKRLVLYGLPRILSRIAKLFLSLLMSLFISFALLLLFSLLTDFFAGLQPAVLNASSGSAFPSFAELSAGLPASLRAIRFRMIDILPALFLCALGCVLFSDACYRLFGRETGILAILVLGASMILIGGLAIPGSFLPAPVAAFGAVLPAALWQKSLLYAVSPELSGLPALLPQLLWIAVFFAAGSLEAAPELRLFSGSRACSDRDRDGRKPAFSRALGNACGEDHCDAPDGQMRRQLSPSNGSGITGALVWARVIFLSAIRRPALWAADLLLLLFFLILQGTLLPYAENTEVVLWGDAPQAEALSAKQDSVFHFRFASDEAEAESLVASGRADCGFLFPDEAGKQVIFLYSQFTGKGAAAMETVFSVLYPDIVEKSLKNEAETVFGRQDEAFLQELEERYGNWLASGLTFSVEFLSEGSIEKTGEGTISLPLPVMLLLYGAVLLLFVTPAAKSPFARHLYPSARRLFLLLTVLADGALLSLPFLLNQYLPAFFTLRA